MPPFWVLGADPGPLLVPLGCELSGTGLLGGFSLVMLKSSKWKLPLADRRKQPA